MTNNYRKLGHFQTALNGTTSEYESGDRRSGHRMLTNGPTLNVAAVPAVSRVASPTVAQTVMIINGKDDVIGLLETVLDMGRYDVVFVESTAHAYSQVKRVRPNLVILCTRIEDIDGFQVLSMLKLDKDTSAIPVLTYTTEFEGQYPEDKADTTDEETFAHARAARMN
jgi:CheY-like chemotaxis protein